MLTLQGFSDMPKSKRSSIRRLSPAVIADPRQRGLHAFQAGRFAEAIVAWTPLAGGDPAVEHLLAPAQALLRGAAVPEEDETPVGHFWRGLGRVAAGDTAASDTLADERPLPSPTLNALRRYYRGLAAVLAGDTDTAQK